MTTNLGGLVSTLERATAFGVYRLWRDAGFVAAGLLERDKLAGMLELLGPVSGPQ